MAKLSPTDAAAKYANNLKGSVSQISAGVDRVTQAPGVKAAAKQAKMLAGITAAIQSGKWAQNVGKVTLADWQAAMKNKGVNRIAAGVDAAQNKMADFYTQLFAFQSNLANSINAMPDNTLEDRINKMVAQVRGMAKFTKK